MAKQEILALTQMAEQINSKFSAQQQQQQNQRKSEIFSNGIKSSNESVDLDNLFAFLSEVTPNGPNSNSIINEIGEKMNHLVEDLDVELESVIQQEIEGLTNEKNLAKSQSSQESSEKPNNILEQQQSVSNQNQMQNSQQSVINNQQHQNNSRLLAQQQANHHPISQQLPQIQPNVINQQQNNKMGYENKILELIFYLNITIFLEFLLCLNRQQDLRHLHLCLMKACKLHLHNLNNKLLTKCYLKNQFMRQLYIIVSHQIII